MSFSYSSSVLSYDLTSVSGLGDTISGSIGDTPVPYNFSVTATGTGGFVGESTSDNFTATSRPPRMKLDRGAR